MNEPQAETDSILRARVKALAGFAEAIAGSGKGASTLVIDSGFPVTRADDLVVGRGASSDDADSEPDLAVVPGHRSHQAISALLRSERDRPNDVELCVGRFLRPDQTDSMRAVFFQGASADEDFETGEISLYLTGPILIDEDALDGAAPDRNDRAIDAFRQVLVDTATLHDIGDPHLGRLNHAKAMGSHLNDGWVVFLCRRPSAYTEFARQLAASADDPKRSLPGALLPFVAFSPSSLPVELWRDCDAASARFPTPSNRQQGLVLEYLARSHCVAVQGPPGTGKSYAIRNLLTHLLAKGKRVLVTSQKAQALNVLVNEGMSTEIAQLCFVVTDKSPKGRKIIKDQIELLARGRCDQADQRRERAIEIDSLREQVVGFAQRDGEALRALVLAEQFERLPLGSPLGPLAPADVAARVAHLPTTPDAISPDIKCPLTDDELLELAKLRTVAPLETMRSAVAVQPLLGGFDVNTLRAEWLESAQLSEQVRPYLGAVTGLAQFAGLPSATIDALRREVDLQRPYLVGIGQLWLRAILDEGEASHAGWADFTKRRRSEVEAIRQLSLGIEGIDVDTSKVLSEADLSSRLVRVAAADASRWQLFKLTRDASPLALVRVDGARPSNWANVRQVEVELRRRKLARAAITAWNATVADAYAGPVIAEDDRRGLRLLAKHCDEIDGTLRWMAGGFARLNQALRTNGIRELSGPGDIAGLEAASLVIEKHAEFARFSWLDGRQRARSQMLREWSSRSDHHDISRGLLAAHDAREHSGLTAALERVMDLNSLRPSALRWAEMLKRLETTAPKWADQIARGSALETIPTLPWDRRRCLALLDERTVRRLIPQSVSQDGRDAAVARLALLEAWSALEQRLGDPEIRSLQAWARALRSKATMRQSAATRQEYADALQTLPAVIMPIEEVIRTFDPSTVQRFDVVIIDESSQCGLGALAVLGLADRAVIVGDDQQISPPPVSAAAIDEAQRKYLGAMPTANALRRASSLYDAAHCCVPSGSQIELVEHFRCDPSIIEFSNRLSYQGRIRPLRIDDVVNPVRSIRVEGTRTANDSNEAEASAVAKAITEICGADPGGTRSVGVIPFISSNVLPFRRQVMELVRRDLGPAFDDEVRRRKIEVKSAWEFQGDERDTIFICLIIDKKSRAMWGDGSRQRINVAASRARDSLVVVHSVDTSDLHTDDVRAVLLRHCTTYEGVAPGKPESAYLGLVAGGSSQDWLTSIPSEQLGLDAIRVGPDGRRSGLAIFGPSTSWPTDRADRVHRARSLASLDGGVEIHLASELVRVAVRERPPLSPPSPTATR